MKRIILASVLSALMLNSAMAGQPLTVGHPFGLGLNKGLSSSSNPLTGLKNITLADLQNALADSNAQVPPSVPAWSAPTPYNSTVVVGSDTRHGNCWAALIQFLTTWQAQNVLPSSPGLALLQQKIFDDQSLVGKSPIPDYVATQCALLVMDAQLNLNQIMGLLGITAIALPKIP